MKFYSLMGDKILVSVLSVDFSYFLIIVMENGSDSYVIVNLSGKL